MATYSKNRAFWDAHSADYQRSHAETLAERPLAWGVWRIPESRVNALGDLRTQRVLELGCGAGQWTAELRDQGVNATGIDVSEAQLKHARAAVAAEGAVPPYVLGDAQALPFADASFDVVFCDHGAMTFASPHEAVAEASRVLRDGGLFAFCMSTPVRDICCDSITGLFVGSLATDYFTLGPLDDGTSVTAQLPYGDWIRLFRQHAFSIENLIELQAPSQAETTYLDFADAAWAARWPAEHIWQVRREPRVGHHT